MSPRNRLLILAAAVVVLVAAFVIAQGSGGDDGGGSSALAPQEQTTAAPAASTDSGTPTTTDGTATTTAPAPKPKPSIPVVRVVGGEPKGGVKRLSYKNGDKIRFRVVSDVADEIHVHGYDKHFDVAAGGSVTVALDATIEGRFEVELENHGVEIVQLEVTP